MKTNIIIFSSKEQLGIAKKLQENFYHKDYSVEVWTNGFFELSKSYIANFAGLKIHYDFAIILLSADDCVRRRKETVYIPRDNVLLELGMCIEAFSLKRTIIVKKDTVRLPSDLSGIQPIEYSLDEGDSPNAVAGAIVAKIDNYIQGFSRHDTLSWDELFLHTKKIIAMLHRSEGTGGYYFDVLVGINRGGLLISDLIGREFGQNKPIISLFADRRSGSSVFDSKDYIINNEHIINNLKGESVHNILLVDSYVRSGNSIIAAKKYLKDSLPGKRIKTAVVYINETLKNEEFLQDIDFFSCYKHLDGKHLSIDNYNYYWG